MPIRPKGFRRRALGNIVLCIFIAAAWKTLLRWSANASAKNSDCDKHLDLGTRLGSTVPLPIRPERRYSGDFWIVLLFVAFIALDGLLLANLGLKKAVDFSAYFYPVYAAVYAGRVLFWDMHFDIKEIETNGAFLDSLALLLFGVTFELVSFSTGTSVLFWRQS